MSPITTHVLDTARGCPAAGVCATLERMSNGDWQKLAAGTTNQDGRIGDLLADDHELLAGIYRLTFDTSRYFSDLAVQSFYPYIAIVFEVKNTSQHYHVPLLLSPFGYSTYRGS